MASGLLATGDLVLVFDDALRGAGFQGVAVLMQVCSYSVHRYDDGTTVTLWTALVRFSIAGPIVCRQLLTPGLPSDAHPLPPPCGWVARAYPDGPYPCGPRA